MDKSAPQSKDNALQSLRPVEHSALEVYHSLDDHNALELRQDIASVLGRVNAWLRNRYQQLQRWYQTQPRALQIAYGLTVIPVSVLVGLILMVFLKFSAPVLLLILLGLKLLITLIKTVAFVGYIIYKILKPY